MVRLSSNDCESKSCCTWIPWALPVFEWVLTDRLSLTGLRADEGPAFGVAQSADTEAAEEPPMPIFATYGTAERKFATEAYVVDLVSKMEFTIAFPKGPSGRSELTCLDKGQTTQEELDALKDSFVKNDTKDGFGKVAVLFGTWRRLHIRGVKHSG